MKKHLLQYLHYIQNTGGNATIAGFDDDWEPIGPKVRAEIMPTYAQQADGKLVLTEAGKAEVLSDLQ